LALYRKYRPLIFSDVISQPHITRTLTNQIINGQTAHAYLFTGSRGTGKTTCAKILAKAINCEKPDGGNPCLVCENCKMIDEGISDIVEIDAASNNSIEDVRLLREELNYLPVACKYRVYIIDEAHMLSNSAFNALLKTIEEPPPHVIFILATTENHKIPATILSRCQRFDFRRIDLSESADKLMEIAKQEGANLEPSAAFLISRLSEGGMRDALSLLDTCISKDDNVTLQLVQDSAGLAGSGHLFSLSEAALDKNTVRAIEILTGLYNDSKDLTRLIDELIYHYRNLMVFKTISAEPSKTFDSTIAILNCMPEDICEYKALSERMSLREIMRCMKILENRFEHIGRSKNARITAEMTVIELCSPELDFDLSSVVARIDAIEQNIRRQPNQVYSEGLLNAKRKPKDNQNKLSDVAFDWTAILKQLPSFLGEMLRGTSAVIKNGEICITGGALTASILENEENRERILKAAEDIGVKPVRIFAEELSEDIPAKNKTEIFLDRVREHGIDVKIK
jgi:DNA polymerase-3 subunit gamma/tau